MSDNDDYRPTTAININFLKATFGFWLAWVTWRMAVPGLEMILILTVIAAAGGVWCSGTALWLMVKMYVKDRKISKFKSRGATPKSDAFADIETLRKGGHTK